MPVCTPLRYRVGSRDIAPLNHNAGNRWRSVCQIHAMVALLLGKEPTEKECEWAPERGWKFCEQKTHLSLFQNFGSTRKNTQITSVKNTTILFSNI